VHVAESATTTQTGTTIINELLGQMARTLLGSLDIEFPVIFVKRNVVNYSVSGKIAKDTHGVLDVFD